MPAGGPKGSGVLLGSGSGQASGLVPWGRAWPWPHPGGLQANSSSVFRVFRHPQGRPAGAWFPAAAAAETCP